MGFGPMDGFFLAVFLAVCIVVAVVLRCLCYRCCMQSCSDKFRHSNEDGILPRHSTPTITPAGQSGNHQRQQHRPRHHQQQRHSTQISRSQQSRPVLPQAGTVFTIYTFPQQPSPETHRPNRSPGPPKYSTVPLDSPPKYEDLFPLTMKDDTDFSGPPSPVAMEMQIANQWPQPDDIHISESRGPPVRDSNSRQAQRSSRRRSSEVPLVSAVPLEDNNLSNTSNSSPLSGNTPVLIPKEAPPLYDAIYPHKSGE